MVKWLRMIDFHPDPLEIIDVLVLGRDLSTGKTRERTPTPESRSLSKPPTHDRPGNGEVFCSLRGDVLGMVVFLARLETFKARVECGCHAETEKMKHVKHAYQPLGTMLFHKIRNFFLN